jgi:hypothetical protein
MAQRLRVHPISRVLTDLGLAEFHKSVKFELEKLTLHAGPTS